jgi:hypothetical protein
MARSDDLATDALAIVEKYEAFVHYLYPILQRCPREHHVLRDRVLRDLFEPFGGLYHAARSRQVSRLHAVDADFATMRAYLRFLAHDTVRIIGRKQHRTALALISEPGRMLGAWLRKLSSSGAERRPKGQAGS